MSTITLKGIPPGMHKSLKQRAALHHRSLNGEMLDCLKQAVTATPVGDADYWIRRAERLHAKMKPVAITHAQFSRFKREGRT